MPAVPQTLFHAVYPLIREKCRRMLSDPDEAEDVAQETFIRLWRSELRDAAPAPLTAWVYRTATRLAIDRLRARRDQREAHAQLRENSEEGHALEGASEARQELELLARKIPARELEVAMLHRLDGLTQPRVAEVAGISERSVRRLLEKLDARLERLRAEARR